MSELSEEYEDKALQLARWSEEAAGGNSHTSQSYAQLSTTYALLAILHKDDQ